MRKLIWLFLLVAVTTSLIAAPRRRAVHPVGAAAPVAPVTVQYLGDAARTSQTAELGPHWLETELWERPLQGPVLGLLQDRGILFAPAFGAVYAIDPVNGADLWVFAQPDVQFSPAAIAGDSVYVNGGNVFYALDRLTGSLLWTVDAGASIVNSTPLIVNDVAYVGTSAGNVIAIDLDAHAEAWRRNLGSPVRSPLASAKEILLAVTDGDLRALKLQDGSDRWSKAAPAGSTWGPAATDRKLVFTGAGSSFYAIDLNTGKTEWVWSEPTLTPPAAGPWSSPMVRNGVVASSTSFGHLIGFRIADGSRKWLFSDGNKHATDAVIGANGTAYFGWGRLGLAGELYSFDFDRGTDNGAALLVGHPTAGPAIGNGAVFFHYETDGGGRLQARKD